MIGTFLWMKQISQSSRVSDIEERDGSKPPPTQAPGEDFECHNSIQG